MLRTLVFCCHLSMLSQASAENQRPNIVLFFIDDLGWRDVGFMGSDFFETPHIDRLADESMKFTAAYSAAPNCAPSRACRRGRGEKRVGD